MRVARPNDRLRIANKASGHLAIGDKKEVDKATWRKPRGIRLTLALVIRDKLFHKRSKHFRVWRNRLSAGCIEQCPNLSSKAESISHAEFFSD